MNLQRQGGQSIVELAICLPVALVLAVGTAAAVRVADARSGLDAATSSAVAAAARQPNATYASWAANEAFTLGCAQYGLTGIALSFDPGGMERGSALRATGTATVGLGFAPLPGLPANLRMYSSASAVAEPWRSR